MAETNPAFFAFNRGLANPLFFGRADIDRYALSAEEQTNFMPSVLGPMSLRPGLGYKYATYNNAKAFNVPFIFATSDLATLEFTDTNMRVVIDDVPLTRVAVSSAVTNGTFNTDLTGWTDEDQAGTTSVWATGGYMSLVGNGSNSARRRQQVTVAGGDQNKEHALRVVIHRGPVVLRVGSTAGGDDYITQTSLGTGTHSLAFTPTGDFHIELSSSLKYATLVDSIAVESAGVVVIPSPYLEADLSLIRYDQSADVIFIACRGYQQRKIERRATRSWSLVLYEPINGPFRAINTSSIRLTPSAISGDITLTANNSFFRTTHVGALFRLASQGQTVSLTASGEDQFTGDIRVIGVGSARSFTINIVVTGWTGTITLQRSLTEPGSWADVASYTTNTSTSFSDGLDNQIAYYRIGVKTGGYTAGTADIQLTFASGSIEGVARVTGFTSSTSVTASVVKDLGGTTSTVDWYEGAWSARRGYPSAVTFYEGRLWWAGKTFVWGSESDGFESFDDSIEGDSQPVSRTIGSGPVDDINWLLPLQRLILGTDGAEKSARSTSFDEPLTNANFNIKNASTLGSNEVSAVVIDNTGLFVYRSGGQIYQMVFDSSSVTSLDYASDEITLYAEPFNGTEKVVRMAVQRAPDTRVHCVTNLGNVYVYVLLKEQKIQAWIKVNTDGFVEDAIVLPSATGREDAVYYTVRRTINGNTVRYQERWAEESECEGGLLNKQADSFVVYDSTATTTITGLGHLEGEEVIVWADGKDVGTKTVASGSITLSTAASKVVVGLHYRGRFKSVKLAFLPTKNGPLSLPAGLLQRKMVAQIGFMLRNTHYQGIKYGKDFDTMDDLPLVYKGETTAADTIYEDYDTDVSEFRGGWDTDNRICFEANAPRPCTVQLALINMEVNVR
jgi:hypothetical protein